MAVSDYTVQPVSVGTNAYVKPVNTAVAGAVEAIGTGLIEIGKAKKEGENLSFLEDVKKRETNIEGAMREEIGTSDLRVLYEGNKIQQRVLQGGVAMDELSQAEKDTLDAFYALNVKDKALGEQMSGKYRQMVLKAEERLRSDINRNERLRSELVQTFRNVWGFDPSGAYWEDYVSRAKAAQEKGPKPTITLFNSLADQARQYAKALPMEQQAAIDKAILDAAQKASGGSEEGLSSGINYLNAFLDGVKGKGENANFTTLYKTRENITAKLNETRAAIAEIGMPSTPEAFTQLEERVGSARVYLDNTEQELLRLGFAPDTNAGKIVQEQLTLIRAFRENLFDDAGNFDYAKMQASQTAVQTARLYSIEPQVLATTTPIAQFTQEEAPRKTFQSMAAMSARVISGEGVITDPSMISQINSTNVKTAWRVMQTAAGSTKGSIDVIPQHHNESASALLVATGMPIYKDAAKRQRYYMPATEFFSSGGIMQEMATMVSENGYLNKLTTKLGKDEQLGIDVGIALNLARASESAWREMSSVNYPEISMRKTDGTSYSSQEIFQTFLKPIKYEVPFQRIASGEKNQTLTSTGNAALFGPYRPEFDKLSAKDKEVVLQVLDRYQQDYFTKYTSGSNAFISVFNYLNKRIRDYSLGAK